MSATLRRGSAARLQAKCVRQAVAHGSAVVLLCAYDADTNAQVLPSERPGHSLLEVCAAMAAAAACGESTTATPLVRTGLEPTGSRGHCDGCARAPPWSPGRAWRLTARACSVQLPMRGAGVEPRDLHDMRQHEHLEGSVDNEPGHDRDTGGRVVLFHNCKSVCACNVQTDLT